MASAYWRTNYTVDSLLRENSVGWEFLQLVRLVLLLEKAEIFGDKKLLNVLDKTIQFKGSLAADFPPSEIRQIQKDPKTLLTHITMVNGVLSAPNGPLPEPFVAWLRELSSRGDHAMAEFFDIFNNRLMALRYLICRSTRPNLIDTAAKNSETGFLLQALSGVFYNRAAESSDIYLSGLLANARVSYPVIKQVFAFSMGLHLKAMNSYQGGWLKVDDSDCSKLGKSSLCQLGNNATLGSRVWDQHKAVELIFDQLSWPLIKELIPGGGRHQVLVKLLKRLTDSRCDCKVILLLPENDVPEIILNKTSLSNKNKTQTLVLGLSTILPIAKKRQEKKETIEICFTVETASSIGQLVA